MADIGQTAPGAAPVNQLSPRQRMEGLLQALPTAGSLLGQAESNQAQGRSELEEPLQRVNEAMGAYGVQFEISEPPGERLVTRIVDAESGDVIRQVPPEEVLKIAERIDELHDPRGGLIDSQV
jgi:flagellar protein FlaG